MDQLQRITERLTGDPDGLDTRELEKRRKELREFMRERVKGVDNESAESMRNEQNARFYNLLADRIPVTEEQHTAVYDAFLQGAKAPINSYDYQSRPSERVEHDVRSATDWMKTTLTERQSETYLRHFLAQIELIRFQNG